MWMECTNFNKFTQFREMAAFMTGIMTEYVHDEES